MHPLRRLSVPSRRTMFSFAKKPLWQLPPNSGSPIPQQELVDEEICPNYKSASFYPARPGEVLAKNYQLLVKIGWGSQSTVWLARDISRFKWQPEQTVTVKILNSNNSDDARHERDIEKHISEQNPGHRGRSIVRTCLDDFEISGPDGKHLCLVYQPLREPFWIYQKRFVNRRLPLPLAKVYIYVLLVALDYLHAECKVVHTDLKLANILMSFENDEILEAFIKNQQCMEHKVDATTGRTIYRCQNDFGPLDGKEIKKIVPKLADFGLSTRLGEHSTQEEAPGEQLGIYPIQPDYYRAPEVVLGCGWGFKADIWNFGVLLWNILGTQELFRQVQDGQGEYSAKSHLAEMIALLGPPPKELLKRSNDISQHDWPQPVTTERGEAYNNARDYFGGPFFNSEYEFLHNELIPNRSLEDMTTFLEEKDRQAFLSFVRDMHAWLPEDRKTARELMDHPFLKSGG